MNTSWNPDPLGYVGELRHSLCRLRRQLDGSSGAEMGVASGGGAPVQCATSVGRATPLNAPDPRTAEIGSAAYLVVMNLGFCRLYGIDVPADLATQIGEALSPDIVVTAARVRASVLTTAIEDPE